MSDRDLDAQMSSYVMAQRPPLNLNQRLDRDAMRIGFAAIMLSGAIGIAGIFTGQLWLIAVMLVIELAAIFVGLYGLRDWLATRRGYVPDNRPTALSYSVSGRIIYWDPRDG